MDFSNASDAGQDHGKARAYSPPISHVGFKPTGGAEIISVQPARLEDLQPSYAQVLNHPTQSSAGHGWYATISKPARPSGPRPTP